MDVLRSCSSQRIRYVASDPSKTAVATWYRAAPTAKAFPGAHLFASPVWDSVHPTLTDLGFQAQLPRTYYNGRRLNSSAGTTWAGNIADFRVGALAPANLPRGANGTPVECLLPPLGISTGGRGLKVTVGRGGIVTGGVGSTPIPPAVPCSNCPTTTPLTVSVTMGGFTGAYAVYNGTFQLVQTILPCVWYLFISGTKEITLRRQPGNLWELNLAGSITITQYSAVVGDCVSSATLNVVFSGTPCNPTASLSTP